MNEKNILVARVLTYTGIMPFLFLGMAVALQASGLDYSLALFAYGAVIISFLCGIHWAVFLFFRKIVHATCCFTATLSAYWGGYQYYRLCLISLSHFRSYVFYICLFLIWSFIATKLFHYGFFTCVLTRQ